MSHILSDYAINTFNNNYRNIYVLASAAHILKLEYRDIVLCARLYTALSCIPHSIRASSGVPAPVQLQLASHLTCPKAAARSTPLPRLHH